jgi:alanine racemase
VKAKPRSPILRCWAEIDLAAIQHNARVAAGVSQCGLIGVIKANAYGLGAVPVARALAGQVKMFGVATLAEALELRAAGIKTPVLLLGARVPEERETVVKHGFVPCISSVNEAKAWDALAKQKRKSSFVVHVAIDTGMGRIGFAAPDWTARTIRALASLKHLRIDGIASHFPSADEDRRFTRKQIQRFGELQMLAVEHGLTPRLSHIGNSAGVLDCPELQTVSNLVRPGLMLYGVSPIAAQQKLLKPVLSWKTHVTLLRDLPKGHSISYGRAFITKKPMRVATLAVGYADGYPRHLSGNGTEVLVRGHRCPVLGRVTMDQIIVDASRSAARLGDDVVLIGRQGREEITPAELAQKAGTIPWEILTRLSSRVQRLYK